MLLNEEYPYQLAKDILAENNSIPLTWWTVKPNFGDLLSPYLVEKMTSRPAKLVELEPGTRFRTYFSKIKNQPSSYLAIGSIISRANDKSIVWGSGAFGTEGKYSLNKHAQYVAVRGPLTRNLLRINGISCPEVYGDPGLLIPKVFNPAVPKKYKVGIILRWAEFDWNNTQFDSDVKKIYLGTSDIEGTLTDIISCEKIVSSSLHGIILADAYGIPSAWLGSTTPKGLEFKFYDYFLSVNKVQSPQNIDFSTRRVTVQNIENQLKFDERQIEFSYKKLLNACPFIQLL